MTNTKAQEPPREFRVGDRVRAQSGFTKYTGTVQAVRDNGTYEVVLDHDSPWVHLMGFGWERLTLLTPAQSPQDAARETAAEYTYITSLGPMPSDG